MAADLHDTLDHLDCAALLIDNYREGRSFDDRSEHWRVDGEMWNAGVLHLEEQGAHVLNDSRETGRLRRRRQSKLAVRGDDNIIGAADQGVIVPAIRRERPVAGSHRVPESRRDR